MSCENEQKEIEKKNGNYLQDEWKINNEQKIIKFEENNYSIIKLFNVIEDNGKLYPMVGSEIGWKSDINDKFGTIKYIKSINDDTQREGIIVTGLPQTTNPIDTIHRIFNINKKW